ICLLALYYQQPPIFFDLPASTRLPGRSYVKWRKNFMETTKANTESQYLSDYAVLIKKMRLLKKLNRQQASLLFDFSFKNLERLENGRGNITAEKFRLFQEKYGFSDQEVEDLRTGKIKASTDANSIRRKIT